MSESEREKQIQLIKESVSEYPDFPKPGIIFRYSEYGGPVYNRNDSPAGKKKNDEFVQGFNMCTMFLDIFSVLAKPELFAMLNQILIDLASKVKDIDCVAGLDSRGFLFAPPLALEMKVPFVPIRKKGKLPGKLKSHTYKLEYGEDTLEIQENAIKKGEKVLLVDDLLATGGSLQASCELISQLGAKVVCSLVCIELTELNGRRRLPCDVLTVLKF